MSSNTRWKVWLLQLTPNLWMQGKAILEQNQCDVMIGRLPTDAPFSEDEIIEHGADVDAILCSGERLTARILENLHQLKVIVRSGIGVDNINVQAATRNGILVANVPVPSDYIGVAEGTIARLLAVAKKVVTCDTNVKENLWVQNLDQLKSVYLRGNKTVGILGLGRIGAHVVRLLQPWNVRIIAYDPYVRRETAELLEVTLVDLDTLLTESDFLSIHATLTEETRHMINEPALRKMKPSAYLINTARGPIIDESALSQALTQGWIAGAALDVFEAEPPIGSPLLAPEIAEKLLLSPHVVALSDEMQRDLLFEQVEICLTALKGQLPASTINPDVQRTWRAKFTT